MGTEELQEKTALKAGIFRAKNLDFFKRPCYAIHNPTWDMKRMGIKPNCIGLVLECSVLLGLSFGTNEKAIAFKPKFEGVLAEQTSNSSSELRSSNRDGSTGSNNIQSGSEHLLYLDKLKLQQSYEQQL